MTHKDSPIACRSVIIVYGLYGGYVARALGADSDARMLTDALCQELRTETFEDLMPMTGHAVITVEVLKDRSCEIDVFGDFEARRAADRIVNMLKVAVANCKYGDCDAG